MDDPTLFGDLPITYENEIPVAISIDGKTYELIGERPIHQISSADLFSRATIHLASGAEFRYLDVANSVVIPTDMAFGLGFEGRFNGQCMIGKRHVYYSVAEHCVRGSYIVPPPLRYKMLMHEPAEMVCKDMPGPLKIIAPEYKALEKSVETELHRKFNVEMSPEDKVLIKRYDYVMLATEQRDLKNYLAQPADPTFGLPMIPKPIRPWSPQTAAVMFLARYQELAPAEAPRIDYDQLDIRTRAHLGLVRALRRFPQVFGIYAETIDLAA